MSLKKDPKMCPSLIGLFNQGPHLSPTDADLIFKLRTLLAFPRAPKVSMIQHFNKEFMSKNKEKYIQTFQKQWESLGSSSFYLVWFQDDGDDDDDDDFVMGNGHVE